MPTLTPLATDELAEHIAHDYLHSCCQHAIVDRLGNVLVSGIYETFWCKEGDEDTEQGDKDKEEAVRPHSELFEGLFKAIAPYEKKFADFLRGIWEQERKIIIANLKKMKKAWLQKDAVDNILYPQGPFVRKITDGTKTLYEQIMETESTRLIDVHEFDIAFDIQNPEVQKWLKNYTFKFAKTLEGVSQEKLRAILEKSFEEGLSIPEIMKKMTDEFEGWSKYRAELVSRSEVIRASNAGAKYTYLQSGVVEKIVWIGYADKRQCDFCAAMDGKVIGIKEKFFELGDTFTIETEGKKQSLSIDYEPCEYPPLHPDCRCTISSYFE